MPADKFIGEVVDSLSVPDTPEFESVIASLRKLPEDTVLDMFESLLAEDRPDLTLGIVEAMRALEYHGFQDRLLHLIDEPGKWFSHEDRDRIRLAAVRSLGRIGDADAAIEIIEKVRKHRDPEFRSEAVKALGDIGAPESIRPLLNLLEENPELALSGTGVIAHIGGEEAVDGLLRLLVHEIEMVRSASIWALGELGDIRAVEPLVILAKRSDALMRRDIVWALGKIGGLSARMVLDRFASADPDLGVRRDASKAIQSGIVAKIPGGLDH